MLCDGQAISRTAHADLFDLIGTTYGAGDGTTTFNLPTLTDPVTGISYMIRVA
jgi:microcystin-dependent protein